jgi:hypothetical protein
LIWVAKRKQRKRTVKVVDVGNNLITGLKAIAGALIHYVIMFVLVIIAGLFFESLHVIAWAILVILLLVSGVFILGWVYNTFWGWK